MNQNVTKQQSYWDKETYNFDTIYSHKKNKLGNFLDSVFRWDMYERYNYTMKNAIPIQDRSFLDVGCGTGRYSLELARRNARKVVGLDISQKMIEICQQRALNERLDNVVLFIQADLLQYQPEIKFDVCIGIGLFDYIKDPLPVLKKMRECINDRAVMSFPRFWTWRAPVRKIRLSLKKCDVHFYTKADIGKLLKKAGFKRYNLKKVGKLHCVTAFVE